MSTTFQKKIPLFCHILINLTLAGLISACSPSPDSNPATIAANDQTYNTGWKFFRSDITLEAHYPCGRLFTFHYQPH
jgi:hypothetical protein